MGTSAASESAGNDARVSAAIIRAGAGFAAGFTAPLLAGLALSGIGFTSKGVAEGSLAASWKESGGSLFHALQSTAQGLHGKVAIGLGAALGTAAAVTILITKGKKPDMKHENKTHEPIDNNPPITEAKSVREVIETVTSKKTIPTEAEADAKLEAPTKPEIKLHENIKEDIVSTVEEQTVHVTLIQNQQKIAVEEKPIKLNEKPLVQDNKVEDVVVEAVVTLASVFKPEKSEIDEKKSEKSSIELVIPAETCATDVVHHSTKPGEEVEMLKEAVEQLVETEAVSEELPSIEECLDRDDCRHVSEEIEILTASGIASPVIINNSVTTSLFQELTADEVQATPFSESVTTSLFQEFTVEDVEKNIESTSDVLNEAKHEETAPTSPICDSITTSLFQELTVEDTEPSNNEAAGNSLERADLQQQQQSVTTQMEETLPREVSKEAFSAIQQVADRLINEIESVLSGGDSNLPESEERESEAKREKEFQKELPQNENKSQAAEKQPETEEIKQKRFKSLAKVNNQDEEESEESAYEEEDSEESDEFNDPADEVEDKDKESEKQLKTVSEKMLPNNATKALEQRPSAETNQERASDQAAGEDKGEFSWETNKNFQATKL